MRTKAYLLGGIWASALLCTGNAQATFTVTIAQVGINVVATGLGTIDTAGLTFAGNGPTSSGLVPSLAAASLGSPVSTATEVYTGSLLGPSSFGSGSLTSSSSGSGDRVIIEAQTDQLAVPAGYVSGSLLADTSTFNNASFASLGLTPGTYTYTFGSGVTADSFVVNIGPTVTVVPEPSSIVLFVTILVGLAFVCRKRLRTSW